MGETASKLVTFYDTSDAEVLGQPSNWLTTVFSEQYVGSQLKRTKLLEITEKVSPNSDMYENKPYVEVTVFRGERQVFTGSLKHLQSEMIIFPSESEFCIRVNRFENEEFRQTPCISTCDSTASTCDSTAGFDDSTASTGDTTASTGDTTASTGDTTASTGDTAASTGDTTDSTGDTTANTDDTTASTDDTTASTDDSTASTGDYVDNPDDSIASTYFSVASTIDLMASTGDLEACALNNYDEVETRDQGNEKETASNDGNPIASPREEITVDDSQQTTLKREMKLIVANKIKFKDREKLTNGRQESSAYKNTMIIVDVNDEKVKKISECLQKFKFKEPCDNAFCRLDSSEVVGIDLGTSKCCVAVVRNGKVEILENERGNKTTPSYVAFTDTERLVGDEAKDQGAMNPTNTVYGVKRLMGKTFDDPSIKRFSDVTSVHDLKKSCTNSYDNVGLTVRYKQKDLVLAPEQISAMLLKKMKTIAESNLEHVVKGAVISVPVAFTSAQRQATLNAGKIAGFEALRLISDPAAVALAYTVQHQRHENLLVVDIGGGCINVGAVDITEMGKVNVKQARGDTYGGTEIDDFLVEHCCSVFKEKNVLCELPPKGLERLRISCRKTKHSLSILKEAFVHVDSLYNGKDYMENVKRELLNDSIKNIKFRLNFLIEKIDCTAFKEVVIVGGTSRVPYIQTCLQEILRDKHLNKSLNADEAVATGATILAAALTNKNQFKNISLKDLHYSNISANFKKNSHAKNNLLDFFGDSYITIPSAKSSHEIDLIENGSKIGTAKYETSKTTQTKRTMNIFIILEDNGLPYNILPVYKEDLFTIKYLCDAGLDKYFDDEALFQQDDEHEKDRVVKMVNLEQTCNETISMIRSTLNAMDYFTTQNLKFANFLERCENIIEWFDSDPNATVEDIIHKRNELERICNMSNERFKKYQITISKLKNNIPIAADVETASSERAAPASATPRSATPGSATPGCTTTGSAAPGPVTPGLAAPGPVRPGSVATGPVAPGSAAPGPATSTSAITTPLKLAPTATAPLATMPPAMAPPATAPLATMLPVMTTPATGLPVMTSLTTALPLMTSPATAPPLMTPPATAPPLMTCPATAPSLMTYPATAPSLMTSTATTVDVSAVADTSLSGSVPISTPTQSVTNVLTTTPTLVPSTTSTAGTASATRVAYVLATTTAPASTCAGAPYTLLAARSTLAANPATALTENMQVKQLLSTNKLDAKIMDADISAQNNIYSQGKGSAKLCIAHQKNKCLVNNCMFVHKELCRNFVFRRWRGCRCKTTCKLVHPPLEDLDYYRQYKEQLFWH